MAIGARSQSARTYLDKNIASFPDGRTHSWRCLCESLATVEELIVHAMQALRDTLPPDASPGLTGQNTAIGLVGKDAPFKVEEDEAQIQTWLDKLPSLPQRAEPAETAAAAGAPAAEMHVDQPAAE